MSEMNNFKKDFVYRTLDILEKYDGKCEVTLLLNCLCGLVTFPIENEKNECKYKIDLFKEKCVKELESLCIRYDFYKRPYYLTFKDIRNSIAHFNIKVFNDEKKIDNISLRAYSDEERPKQVFSIKISVKNLKKFAEFVANKYIDIIDDEAKCIQE